MDNHEVAVIGAGPAGIAASIQLGRYGINQVVFEQNRVGGLLHNARLVENYPGFPHGIPGTDLADLMREQFIRTGVDLRRERVASLDYRGDRFFLRTTARELSFPIAVVASGTEPRKIPDLAIPDDIMDRVLYEVYPIRHVQFKNIAVIGAGDAAFDYALNLARRNEVTILSRSESARCNVSLWDEATDSLHISYMRNVEVQKVVGRTGRLLISCGHLDRSDMTTIMADYLVIAVGREPATHFFTRGLAEQSAYLTLNHRLHLVGDARNGLYRQASISVGNGIEAAMHIARHLRA